MEDFFNSISARPTISWLNEQIENHFTQNDIINFFLHNDLRITSEPIINPSIFSDEGYTFDSNMLVQIDEIIDISIPSLKRKCFNLNDNEKRITLKFLLSDGHYQFTAISKTFLPEFDPRIIPGLKIQILKDTIVKFGVIFLEKEKVEIVGGHSLDLIQKRHSIVIYDEKKYKDQQLKDNENVNQLLFHDFDNHYIKSDSQKETKSRKNLSNKRKSTLIITKENEKQNNNKSELQKFQVNQDLGTLGNNLTNSKNSTNSCQKTIKPSFLDDDSDFESNDIFEKELLEKNIISLNNNNKSEPTILDQLSNSSYSSDVEIINSIINKNDNQNLSINDNIQKNQTRKKFLSDDDLEDDFDFDTIQKEYGVKCEGKIESNNSDITKTRILSLSDLLRRENIMKSKIAPSNLEIILLDGKIVECNEIQIIQKKSNNFLNDKKKISLFFSMSCKIACSEKTMEMNVASNVICNFLELTPEDWMNLDYKEQIKRYEECSKYLLSFKSPLYVLCNNLLGAENNNRYFIVDNSILALVESDDLI